MSVMVAISDFKQGRNKGILKTVLAAHCLNKTTCSNPSYLTWRVSVADHRYRVSKIT